MILARPLAASRRTLPAFAVVGIYWGAFAAQAPALKARIDAADGAFGLALLCAAAGAVISMWLAPRIDRRLGPRGMQAAALATALAFLLPGIAPTVPLFGAAMFLCGAGSGLLDVVMNARVAELEARQRLALMNLNHAGFSFAYAASAVATGFAREAGAAPLSVFASLGVVTLACAAVIRLAPDPGPEDEAHPSGPGYLKVVLWAGLITLIAFMTENATEAWSALHIERTLGGRAAEGALGPAVLGLTMGTGRLLGHFLTPHGRERTTIVAAALVAGAGAAIAARAGSPAEAYVGFAILGFGVSVIAPLAFAITGQSVPARVRALAISRTAMISYFGFFIGPPTMGFVSEAFGLRASFGVMSAAMLSLPFLLLPLRGRRASAPSAPAALPIRPRSPSE